MTRHPPRALGPLALLLLALWLVGCSTTPPPAGDSTAPAAPSGLIATAGDGSVALLWSANAEPDLARYRVLMGEGSAASEIGSVDAGSESYLATGLSNGTSYTFAVVAEDTSDNRSDPSAEATATPQSAGNDSTPPTIVAIEPADGATDVARNASVRISYSEPMLQAEFTLSPADSSCIRSWNPENTVLTCQWDTPLAADTSYTVTLGTDSIDLAGNPLTAAVSSSFTTGSDSNPVCLFDDATTPFGACVFGN